MKKGFATFLVIILIFGLVYLFLKDNLNTDISEIFQSGDNPLITGVGIIIAVVIFFIIAKAIIKFLKTSFGR